MAPPVADDGSIKGLAFRACPRSTPSTKSNNPGKHFFVGLFKRFLDRLSVWRNVIARMPHGDGDGEDQVIIRALALRNCNYLNPPCSL